MVCVFKVLQICCFTGSSTYLCGKVLLSIYSSVHSLFFNVTSISDAKCYEFFHNVHRIKGYATKKILMDITCQTFNESLFISLKVLELSCFKYLKTDASLLDSYIVRVVKTLISHLLNYAWELFNQQLNLVDGKFRLPKIERDFVLLYTKCQSFGHLQKIPSFGITARRKIS